MMRSQLLSIPRMVLACALIVGASPVDPQDVRTTSYTLPSGERVLQHELEVDVPLGDVWRTFTTADGLRSFLAPVVGLDFRVGGKLETSYSATTHLGDPANIVSEIVTYLPMDHCFDRGNAFTMGAVQRMFGKGSPGL